MQGDLFQSIPQRDPQKPEPVTCMGQTFQSDAERRSHFLELLAEKLKDPSFRATPGFPEGSDEDILALSDPPYYTACPNPFLKDLLKADRLTDSTEDTYHREPFAADVSEGKNHPIYAANSYHTKVPHRAIMRYILHYTQPGDVVLDGFSGSGMTGVAAQLCGNAEEMLALGVTAKEPGVFGARRCVLSDLSPAASLLSYTFNTPVRLEEFQQDTSLLLKSLEENLGWVDETQDEHGRTGKINYTLWSDVFLCNQCSSELVFWDVAVDEQAGAVKDDFVCPTCNALLTKKKLLPVLTSYWDPHLNTAHKIKKQVPVQINFTVQGKKKVKKPDEADLQRLSRMEQLTITDWFPTARMRDGEESRRNDNVGFTHTHHFYTARNLMVLAHLNSKLHKTYLKGILQSILTRSNKQSSLHVKNYFFGGGGVVKGHLTGTLYVPSLSPEPPATKVFSDRLEGIKRALPFTSSFKRNVYIGVSSASHLLLDDACIDYIFTDPPFGANLMYSELNFINDSWLRVVENNTEEGIMNKVQRKGLPEYQNIMEACFREYFRVLKPGRWMTVEFSNSSAAVWNSIQQAVTRAGFVVADVRALDKKQLSFKAVNSVTAVKQDLVISVYKPRSGMMQDIAQKEGTAESAFAFVRGHLHQLPIFVEHDNKVEVLVERTEHSLFDRMVAYHVQRNKPVPLDKTAFVRGLREQFFEEDGMFFLPEQFDEYKTRKQHAGVLEMEQAPLFVNDEKGAIAWIRQALQEAPQTRRDLHTEFIKALQVSDQRNVLPELDVLLAENFIMDDATGQWYVPDLTKEGDVEKIHQRSLLRTFNSYLEGKGVATKGRLKGQLETYRLEAVRYGFEYSWNEGRYGDIVKVGQLLPETVLNEDEHLSLYYYPALLQVDSQ